MLSSLAKSIRAGERPIAGQQVGNADRAVGVSDVELLEHAALESFGLVRRHLHSLQCALHEQRTRLGPREVATTSGRQD